MTTEASIRMRATLQLMLAITFAAVSIWCNSTVGEEPEDAAGTSAKEAQINALRTIPFNKLNRKASQQIREVLDRPSFYRRMPTQVIECEPEIFNFLVRRPEVMVNIWDMMGITKVSAQRTSPVSFAANDGVGTACKCDLVYGSDRLHIYYGTGEYSGNMTLRRVTGKCVCVLTANPRQTQAGQPIIAGTMDVFLKLDNIGADLITRTLAPFVGKTADYNFVETAKFISQISKICQHNPMAAQGLAMRLDKVDSSVKREFASLAAKIASEKSGPLSLPQMKSPVLAQVNPSSVQPERKRGATADDPQYTTTEQYAASRSSPTRQSTRVPQLAFESYSQTANSDDAPLRSNDPAGIMRSASGESQALSNDSGSSRGLDKWQPVDSTPPSAISPFKPHIIMRK